MAGVAMEFVVEVVLLQVPVQVQPELTKCFPELKLWHRGPIKLKFQESIWFPCQELVDVIIFEFIPQVLFLRC